MAQNKAVRNVALITFGVFMAEAILHYNIGRKSNGSKNEGFKMPSTKDMVHLGLVVGAFSIVNSMIIQSVNASK